MKSIAGTPCRPILVRVPLANTGGEDVLTTTGEYFLGDNGVKVFPIKTKNSRDIYEDANFDGVFQKGNFLENNLTITGGSGKTTNFFSIGNLTQKGIVRNSDYNRFTMRFNNGKQ